MAIYYSKNNKQYILNNIIGKGGEGEIYSIENEPNLVAKKYIKPELLTSYQAKKLERMAEIKKTYFDQRVFKFYAWPEDAIYDKHGNFIGFVMQYIPNSITLREFYTSNDVPNKLNLHFNNWNNALDILLNLCINIHNIHCMNECIGDLNAKNILLVKCNYNILNVYLICADSYHITKSNNSQEYFRCKVGQSEFLAPELQGVNLENNIKTFNKCTDLFSLAVLIFKTLINGVHPFNAQTCTGPSVPNSQLEDTIKSGNSPFFKETNKLNAQIPKQALDLSYILPERTINLFKKDFVDGINNPTCRPSAKEWYDELKYLKDNLKQCGKRQNHFYYKDLQKCPWCKINAIANGNNIDICDIQDDIVDFIKAFSKKRDIKETDTFYFHLSLGDNEILKILKNIEEKYNILFSDEDKKKIKNENDVKTVIKITELCCRSKKQKTVSNVKSYTQFVANNNNINKNKQVIAKKYNNVTNTNNNAVCKTTQNNSNANTKFSIDDWWPILLLGIVTIICILFKWRIL